LSSSSSNNQLLLAVAGSGKTTRIVDECAASSDPSGILALTYTLANQAVLTDRLRRKTGMHGAVRVQGWFSFLISEIARPFVPVIFPGARVSGFDFISEPQTYVASDSWDRYFTRGGEVRRVHLAQLCSRILDVSGVQVVDRLSRIYSHIYVDEAQDLSGYDLEILKVLFASTIEMRLVGDVRQAVVATNERDPKNKQYRYMGIWKWFQEQAEGGNLQIEQRNRTRRCPHEVAEFADSLFDSSHGFETTVSENQEEFDHRGIYLVKKADVPRYLDRFAPLFLKDPRSAKDEPYVFVNFRISKGTEADHVLIWPTGNIERLLRSGTPLATGPATHLYVAVTRARQSVAFVLDSVGRCEFREWSEE
jgi:superfamily I DNA/RNA helicase